MLSRRRALWCLGGAIAAPVVLRARPAGVPFGTILRPHVAGVVGHPDFGFSIREGFGPIALPPPAAAGTYFMIMNLGEEPIEVFGSVDKWASRIPVNVAIDYVDFGKGFEAINSTVLIRTEWRPK